MLQPNRSNIILYCKQWEKTVRFYEQILDFEINFRSDWFVEFHIHDGSYLSIANEARSKINSAAGNGVTLTWRVDALQEAHAYLEQRGVSITAIQHKWGAQVCYMYDPEGHRIELWQEQS